MAKTNIASFDSGDLGKWVTLAIGLVGVGVLPAKYGKPLALAAVGIALLGLLGD